MLTVAYEGTGLNALCQFHERGVLSAIKLYFPRRKDSTKSQY